MMDGGHFQIGALPWRTQDGALHILLVTTRTTRRWMVPKGWPMADRTPHDAAALEAWEEAGIRGNIGDQSVGHFHYDKVRKDGSVARIRVEVFPLEVTEEAGTWKEAHERDRQWFEQGDAAAAVEEPELKALIAGFAP